MVWSALHVLLIRFQLIHFYHISPKNPCFATWDDILRLHSRFYQIISDHANSKQKQEEDHMLTKKLHASDSTVLIFLLKREAPIHWQCLLAISLWLYIQGHVSWTKFRSSSDLCPYVSTGSSIFQGPLPPVFSMMAKMFVCKADDNCYHRKGSCVTRQDLISWA
jgi:hypothetical protein